MHFDPESYREKEATKRRTEINDRIRSLSAGILAVVWGLLVGESKTSGISAIRVQLLGAAALSISAWWVSA